MSGRLPRAAAAACLALFIVLVFVLLACISPDYLRKAEELSIFMSGSTFFRESLSVPGGLVHWSASFLMQFFYYPWLGTCVTAMLLVGLWLLIYKAFGLPQRFFALAGIPSALFLLAMLTPGYTLYVIKTPGYFFTGPVGTLAATALFYVFRLCRHTALRMAVSLCAVLLYPLLGFYALLAATLCVAAWLSTGRPRLLAFIPAIALAAVPYLYFYFTDNYAMAAKLYSAALPRLADPYPMFMAPFVCAFVLLAALAAAWQRWPQTPRRPARGLAAACALFALALIWVVGGRYSDKNFATSVKMDMAITDGDYERAVRVARSLKERPTRLNGLFTHLALSRLGVAGDSLFTFRMSDAEYIAPDPTVALREMGGRGINFNFGYVNNAYRWCMESMVENGPKVEYLKYMAKCALINNESALARRYARMLEKTLFHKDEARKLLAMADDSSLIVDDPELSTVKTLNSFNNLLGGDGALIETYLSRSIAGMQGGPPAMVDLSIQFNLVLKNISDFWPRFMLYARNNKRLPVHYQEAAILFSNLEKKVDWRQFNIDPLIAARFERFMQLAQQNSRMTEDYNREAFAPAFGDTYWYYYFFTKGLKTT